MFAVVDILLAGVGELDRIMGSRINEDELKRNENYFEKYLPI